MNTPNTTPDIAETAREVLEADRARQEFSASNPFGAWDILAQLQQTFSDNAPHLAHAVERGLALADRLDAEAADDFDGVSGTSVSLVKYETAKAIRAALNGETA